MCCCGRDQHAHLDDSEKTLALARQCVAGKIQNARTLLLRSARDTHAADDIAKLHEAADSLGQAINALRSAEDLNTLRGVEGIAARRYFEAFNLMLKADNTEFALEGRNRRPPRDRPNALLSFAYALLRGECEAALEGVGLDPQVGYLHSLRPGRPSLALDLMEELRPAVADRFVLRLVNRRQIRPAHFEETPGGAVRLTDDGRRSFLQAYQQRKTEQTAHRVLKQSIAVGLVPHIQARLLARHIRGDLSHYIPFTTR